MELVCYISVQKTESALKADLKSPAGVGEPEFPPGNAGVPTSKQCTARYE